MTILNPREYKLKYPNAYLGDYLTYLELAQKDAEQSIKDAKTLPLRASNIENIQRQAEEIFQMAMIVEEYMGYIILKSIDTLTLEELQSYFNFDAENKASEEKKSSLEEERSNIQARLEEIEKQIESNLYAYGRVKDFYEVEDAGEFFTENEKPDKFLENLLSDFILASSPEEFADELKQKLIVVLQTECQIQNIELSSDNISELCDKVMELFRKCKNILRFSPDAKEQLSNIILSESGIRQILPDDFDENTAIYLIHDLMNLKKLNMEFYINLPISLKESLASGRLQGTSYEALLRTYQAFLNGEELPSDDLSKDEKAEKKELDGKLEKINRDLVSLDNERVSREEFLIDEDAMRADLRRQILEMIGDQVSAKDIDAIITEEESKFEKLKNDLSEASSLLAKEKSNLEKAQAILLDQNYHYFFEAVEMNNVRRLYKAFGVNVTEEFILPFLEEEKRRLSQFEIMIALQDKLSSIYDEIKTKKAKSNIFTRNLPSYKESLRALDEKYQTAIKEAFEELKQKGLFYINVPQISDDSTVGNVIVLPAEYHQDPTNFSEVNGLKQTFWNRPTCIDDNTKKRILATNPEFNNWDDFYQNLMKEQEELVNKLFSFEKCEDNYYSFASSEGDREKLKHLQSVIIEILSSVYEERKVFRQNLGDSTLPLDPDKVSELEYFLGSGANLSRENLAAYIDQTQAKITKLKELLTSNREFCMSLGIEIPADIAATNVPGKDETRELEKRIQSLNIDGVTNLKEAISYRNLLLGLEEYNVPPAKVKQYYLEHKNN